MKESDNVHDMELNEQIKVRVGVFVTRVPGGWLYSGSLSSFNVFVPYSSEFNKNRKKKSKSLGLTHRS